MAITVDPTPEELDSATDQPAPPSDAELRAASDSPSPPSAAELASATDSPEKQPMSAGQEYLGAFENAADTATAGLSKIAEQHPNFIPGPIGIAARALQAAGETTPEKVAEREQALPTYANVASTLVGAAGFGALAGPGLAALLPEMTGATGVASRIATAATEGAAYNTTKGAATRESMGDPALDAQKMIADAKMGALWGAGTGALFESARPLVGAIRRAMGYNGATGDATTPPSTGPMPPDGGQSGDPELVGSIPDTAQYVDSTPVPKKGIQATNVKEIQEMNEAARKRGESFALPQQNSLYEATQNVPMKYPITRMQYESLEDQLSRDSYLATQVNPDGSGKPILDRETLQRNELNGLTDDAIKSIAPGVKLTSDANVGGKQVTDAFTNQYQSEQSALKPLFKQFDSTTKNPVSNILAYPEPLEQSVPGITGDLSVKDGNLFLAPWKPTLPYSEAVHSAITDIVNAANDPETTVSGIRNLRDNLSKYVNTNSPAKDFSQIGGLKKSLMDYMQKAVDEGNAPLQVRDTFRRYAINQQKRDVIEKVFGSSVGATNFGTKALKGLVNESIAGKIFKDSATVDAAKQILPKDQFNHALANFLTNQKELATKDGVFSSAKFYSMLNKNRYALNVAFKDNPQALKMLQDINTITRIIPDSAPANPSGTAKTLGNLGSNLFKALGPEDIFVGGKSIPFKGVHELWKVFQRTRNEAKINTQLEGIDAINQIHQKIGKAAAKVSNQISDDAKQIFTGLRGAGYHAAPLGDYDKKTQRIRDLASNPNDMIDHMTHVTSAMSEAAPEVAQGIHSSMAAAIGFLNQKLPKPTQELPLSAPWNPSIQQKKTFSRYYQTVDDPISALQRVKNGSLNSQDMEALQAVHPDLLNEMKMNVMQNIKKETAHMLPTGTKIALSKFLGQPLDENMTPFSIQTNQAAYAQPQQPKVTVKGTKNLNMAKRSAGQTDES